MFFTQFMTWLADQLQFYVSTQTQSVGAALAPSASALAAVYVMGWGYLHLTGSVNEPLVEGIRRIIVLGIVLGVALHLWLYNEVIVALLVQGPRDLAASLLGAPDPVGLIDTIWAKGGECADVLWTKGGVFSGDVGFYLAGAAVWLIVGLLCLYCAFLLALSQVATAILLAIGPMFILAYLFERTRQLFEAWVSQLLNYGLISLLVALVASLLLQVIASYATQTASLGTDLTTVDVLDLLLATGLVLLILRQVMPIAAGLARGVSLSTLGSFGESLRSGRHAVMQAGTLTYEAAFGTGAYAEETMTTPSQGAPTPPIPPPRRRVRPVWRREA